MNNYLQSGNILTLTATEAVTSELPYIIGNFFVIAADDAASGDEFAGYTSGKFTVVKDAGTAWSEGDLLYWDETDSNFTPTPAVAANRLVGIAANDATSGAVVGNIFLMPTGIVAEGPAELVTSGAISLLCRTTKLSVTGTQAYTLADGLYLGQRKSLICYVAASTPDGTVTPANFFDGTNIDFDAVLESTELEWDGTNWFVINLNGNAVA